MTPKQDARTVLIRLALAAAEKYPNIKVTVLPSTEEAILDLDGWVYITPAKVLVAVSSICRKSIVEEDGFVVQRVHTTPGGVFEPDSVDIVDIAEFRWASTAVQRAFLTVFEHDLNEILSSVEEDMAMEYEAAEEKRLGVVTPVLTDVVK